MNDKNSAQTPLEQVVDVVVAAALSLFMAPLPQQQWRRRQQQPQPKPPAFSCMPRALLLLLRPWNVCCVAAEEEQEVISTNNGGVSSLWAHNGHEGCLKHGSLTLQPIIVLSSLGLLIKLIIRWHFLRGGISPLIMKMLDEPITTKREERRR